MKKNTLILFLFFIFNSANSQSTCDTAIPLNTDGLYVVDAVNGTQIPSPICAVNGAGATAGKWFAYTPTQNYTVTISTDITANTPRKDTRFHVYTGGCSALLCYSGDDDTGSGFSSVATFNVSSGTTYYITFDNKWSAVGFTFQLIQNALVPIAPNTVSFTSQTIGTINSSYNICIVDMNNDYLDDIVGVNATSIRVHTQNSSSGFTLVDHVTENAVNLPSWSLAAGDYNKDGFNDLMYGGGSGITFMKSNNIGTAYTNITPPQYVFCQRTNFVDLNNDGNLDAFSCHDVDPNVYFLNNSSGNLTFYQSGTTPGAMSIGIHPEGGNYGTIWIDYDNDGDQDLFIAKCRGGSSTAKYNELHRNNGNGTFTDVSVASNLYDPVQTWSAAWADFDNDGDMDAIIGASSTADGSHKFMNNLGNGTFGDITAGSGWDTNTSTNIEHIAYDFNNDGWVDVMGGGNKIMMNQGNGTFLPTNVGFGVGSVGDLNNDGFLDIQTGSTLHMNVPNANNWIKFSLQGIASNSNGIGARVEIYGAFGKQIRDVRSGEGFRYMSTLNVHFGIGLATAVTQVIIKWPSGAVDTITNPTVNQMLHVVEGSTLGVTSFINTAFSIYPNPVTEILNIKSTNSNNVTFAQIYDLNGKLLLESNVTHSSINVNSLAKGTYILLMRDENGKDYGQKFIKE